MERRSRLRIRIGLALTVALVAAACGGAASPGGGSASASPSPAPVTLPASATELPEFTPAAFRQLLAGLKGTPVLVNIWASWCGPCVQEAPALAAMSRQYAGEVQFIGVDILDNRVPARAFIQQFGWTYPSVFDPDGAIRDDLGLIGQPHTLIFDASGQRVFVWSGAISEPLLRQELSKASA